MFLVLHIYENCKKSIIEIDQYDPLLEHYLHHWCLNRRHLTFWRINNSQNTNFVCLYKTLTNYLINLSFGNNLFITKLWKKTKNFWEWNLFEPIHGIGESVSPRVRESGSSGVFESLSHWVRELLGPRIHKFVIATNYVSVFYNYNFMFYMNTRRL